MVLATVRPAGVVEALLGGEIEKDDALLVVVDASLLGRQLPADAVQQSGEFLQLIRARAGVGLVLVGIGGTRLVLDVPHRPVVHDAGVLENDRGLLHVGTGVDVVILKEPLDRVEDAPLHHLDVAACVVVLEHVVHVPGRVRLAQAHRPFLLVEFRAPAVLSWVEQPDEHQRHVHGRGEPGAAVPGPAGLVGLAVGGTQRGMERVHHVGADGDPQIVVLIGEAHEDRGRQFTVPGDDPGAQEPAGHFRGEFRADGLCALFGQDVQ
ncbi:hypothetical protein [Streptomyces prunicolor]|uniref:Uncharacterized protein n=1 Tax=Streptomyces prunicolor TaxID=67348 RepID=A0ABU4FJE3_9ACTN|nr:hypothetical protein [Streptomyces prunicolor]MDV7220133.1 hypothetical protein [Streptomyces prunicolor]